MKKNLLSKNEDEIIRILQERFVNALEKRIKNPSDFKVNVTCLGEIAEAVQLWGAVYLPHLENKERAQQEASESNCFGFFKKKASNNVLKEILILDHLKMKLKEKKEIKMDLAAEPRIISFSFDWNEETVYTTRQKKREITSQHYTQSYKITFSDDSTLTLSDLSDTSLINAKIQFDEKMKALETTTSYAFTA